MSCEMGSGYLPPHPLLFFYWCLSMLMPLDVMIPLPNLPKIRRSMLRCSLGSQTKVSMFFSLKSPMAISLKIKYVLSFNVMRICKKGSIGICLWYTAPPSTLWYVKQIVLCNVRCGVKDRAMAKAQRGNLVFILPLHAQLVCLLLFFVFVKHRLITDLLI